MARSKGRICGSRGIIPGGSFSTQFVLEINLVVGRMRLNTRMSPSLMEWWAVVLHHEMHPKAWSPNGSIVRPHGHVSFSALSHSSNRSLRLRLMAKFSFLIRFRGSILLMVIRASERPGFKISSRRSVRWGDAVFVKWVRIRFAAAVLICSLHMLFDALFTK
jgi:hypothetical protein